MVFGKSITFDEEDIGKVASATGVPAAYAITDSDFLDRLRNGDPDAFDTFITRYSGEIYSLLYRMTGDPEEAGDLTQETFLSALKSIKSFRGESELKTWLFRIAVNHSRNKFRWWKRRKRSETISLDKEIGDGTITVGDTLSDDSESPEEAVLRLERRRQLMAALNGLPEMFREAVVLCDIEGLGYEEIARVLAINVGTVKSRLARGREQLRKRLGGF
ncbi:MAG TPA: sigma-70 family RNA polymerase sigma factor [Pyrinomonadaceae bacterium]|nr:sigma-70 family RNA polymerase sigma factor [Pyrinomonadaceae bacterium]